MIIIMFLIYVAGQVLPAIWPFYTKYLYKWSDLEIGYSLAFVGIMIAIVKGGMINWSHKRFGPVGSIYIGLIFTLIGLNSFAFANQSWMLYFFILVYCLGGIAPPSLQGLISGRMPENEQGELQGMITSLMSLANIISPLIMTNLFYIFTNENASYHFPGAPFAMAAIIVFIGLLLLIKELSKKNRNKSVEVF